jgi:hypothetical protein
MPRVNCYGRLEEVIWAVALVAIFDFCGPDPIGDEWFSCDSQHNQSDVYFVFNVKNLRIV